MGFDEPELTVEEEKKREQLNRLRVMEGLTDEPRIVLHGNALSDGLGGRMCLWVGEPRGNGKPTWRTRKAERCLCSEQDILDACVALANIAEVVAPYAWEHGLEDARSAERGPRSRQDRSPERLDGLDRHSTGWKKLIAEVASFVNQFGLLHMASGKRPFSSQGWLRHHLVSLAEDGALGLDGFKARDEDGILLNAQIRASMHPLAENAQDNLLQAKKEILEERKAEFIRKNPGRPGALDAEAYYADRYRDSLKSYAKDFSGYPRFEERARGEAETREKLRENHIQLRRDRENARAWGDVDKEKECAQKLEEIDYRLSDLGADTEDLEEAIRSAGDKFKAERGSLEANGVWEVNLYAFYQCSLLLHDALEMLAAIGGDEAAFNRLLPKFHMDYLAPEEGEKRHWTILWFESAGIDYDNPQTENSPIGVEVMMGDERVFRERDAGWGMNRCYGGGRWHAVLCEEGVTAGDFRGLVRKNLPECLNGLIEQGVTANYKGRFAEPFGLGRDTHTYIVNDRDHDLFSTMWHALKLVVDGVWALNLCRCEACGRIIRIKRTRNGSYGRRTCDAACRQRKSRGRVDEEAMALKQRYLEYMGSPEAIRLGLPSIEEEYDGPDDGPSYGFWDRVKSSLRL